ncbi:Histidinol dehydrogenase [Ceratocystis lukuohia]|uniref:Histidine biosynthesis trifunctional protein n=1 Tax=Ceratocystis lukuohia TaxID=2019550 RepID=A0ABR4MT62_9PEZI
METVLPLPFVVGIPASASGQGLTESELSILGSVLYESASSIPKKTLLSKAFVNGTGLAYDDVATLLDQGIGGVFVPAANIAEFVEFGSRVLPIVESTGDITTSSLVSNFDVATVNAEALKAQIKAAKGPVFVRVLGSNAAELTAAIEVAKATGAIAVLPSSSLTTAAEAEAGDKLPLERAFSLFWKSDRADGLLPTVVVDEREVSLGLVYSSAASVNEAVKTAAGVYQSRKRGLWVKGLTSGDTQELVSISLDCDMDALKFVIRQKGRFCHLEQFGCFGELRGLSRLEATLKARKESAPAGSYTARLFSDEKLLRAKIMEEAEELCDAANSEEVSWEAADLFYFALTKAVASGVSLSDIERNLDSKSLKVKRRKGDAKGKWAEKEGIATSTPAAPVPTPVPAPAADGRIAMKCIDASKVSATELTEALKRPAQRSPDAIVNIINPIIQDVKNNGDAAVLKYTRTFEKATSLESSYMKAPFAPELMDLPAETKAAIDLSFENIRKFHVAQKEDKPLQVETMPGVVCSRFVRPIEAVGLYIPGGTAVLPSTALMLAVPAMVAGCERLVFATPPRSDGKPTPEVVYVAHKTNAEGIVLAGGAQAVAALAYGTESIPKVDKIVGPGNQFVTTAKMVISNDTNACVSIDMPAGPSEVLVVADNNAVPAFVASDLLSQAEHGKDSQVILIGAGLSPQRLQEIEDELHNQAMALPRIDAVRGSISHSVTILVKDTEEAMRISNEYAPEHLILQVDDAEKLVDQVKNAGSVFIGQWTPESVGDYSAGVNHCLPTYGYARQYSGLNLASFVKHITSSNLSAEGLKNVGGAVMELAGVEELDAHKRAVGIRLDYINKNKL